MLSMSAIIKGNKRTTSYDQVSGDIAGTYLWRKDVTDKIAGTTLIISDSLPRMVPIEKKWSQFGNQKSLGLLGYMPTTTTF